MGNVELQLDLSTGNAKLSTRTSVARPVVLPTKLAVLGGETFLTRPVASCDWRFGQAREMTESRQLAMG